MYSPSRSTLKLFCIVSTVLAVAGWTVAWKNDHGSGAEEAVQQGGGRTGKSGLRGSSSELAGRRLASDPRTIQLLDTMEGLDASAVAGKPNPAFVKAIDRTLNDSLFHRRQRDFRLLLEKMRPEDAIAVHEHFAELERQGRPFAEEYAAFAMRWGQVDGEGAMAFWTARKPFDLKFGDMIGIMNGWGSTDPQKAFDWVEHNGSALNGMADSAVRPIMLGWLNHDSVGATEWLRSQNLPPAVLQDCVGGATLDKIYSDGLVDACGWLAELGSTSPEMGNAALNAWRQNQDRLQNLDPTEAAAAWSKLGSQPWMGAQQFSQFCQQVARANQGDLTGFADELSKHWAAKDVTAQFERWAQSDPHTATTLLFQLPASSPVKQAASEGLRRAVAAGEVLPAGQ